MWRNDKDEEDYMAGTRDPKDNLHCHKHVIFERNQGFIFLN